MCSLSGSCLMTSAWPGVWYGLRGEPLGPAKPDMMAFDVSIHNDTNDFSLLLMAGSLVTLFSASRSVQ